MDMEIYLYVAAGVAISIVLPILRRLLPTTRPLKSEWWKTIKPFVIIGITSLLAAILIVALLDETLQDWKAAILAGYAWDSFIQKIVIV